MSWKKQVRRGLSILIWPVAALLLGGFIWVRTASFDRFIVGDIARAAERATGERLTIQKLEIHWTRLSADAYGLILRKSSTSPPFLACGHVYVSLTILSLWRHKIVLNDLLLDDPVLDISINGKGQNNLPHAAQPSAVSATDRLFDLGVRRFKVNSGEVEYNDQRIPISADLQDVGTEVGFNAAAQNYQGSLAYRRGTISGPHLRPFAHQLQLNFEATRSTFRLNALYLSAGRTRLRLSGTLADYTDPRIEAAYQAAIFTPDLARMLNLASLPAGQAWTTGSLQYDYTPARRFLEAIQVDGRLDSPELVVNAAGVRAGPREIRAAYTLRDGNLQVSKLAAQFLGGSVAGQFAVRDLEGAPRWSLTAHLGDVSLSGLTESWPSRVPQNIRLSGRLNANVEAACTGRLSKPMARIRATISGPLAPPAQNAIPVDGTLDVDYDGPRDTATFLPSTLRTGNTQISFHGSLGKHSNIAVEANARDLDELARLVSSWPLAGKGIPQSPSSLMALELRGSATFVGQILGRLESPRVQGRVNGNDIEIKGITFPAVQAAFSLESSELSIEKASATGPNKAQLTLHGDAGLDHWSFTHTSALSLEARASGISLGEIERMAGTRYHLGGELTADVSFDGTVDHPAGQASIEISQARTGKATSFVGLKKVATIRLEGNGNQIQATAQVELPAGAVSANGTYAPRTGRYSARVNLPAIDLSKIQPLVSLGVPVSGVAAFSASGAGTITQPQVSATLAVPALHIQDQTISNLRAQLNLANERASFNLNATVAGGFVEANGEVGLHDPYPATASVNVRGLPIRPLLAACTGSLPPGVRGQTELHAMISGPLKKPQEIRAEVQIPALDVEYQEVRLSLAEPTRIDYAKGTASIAKTEIRGAGTELTLEGTIPFENPAALNLAANGSINLNLLQNFETGFQSSGQILVHVTTQGEARQPNMRGQILVQDASFLSQTAPFAFEHLNGRIRVSGTRLDIEQLQATMGGGTLSATGFFDYGRQKSFDLSAVAKTVRLRYPSGIRSLLAANLALRGTTAAATLTGRVMVDRLSFAQEFDLANFIGQFSTDVPSAAPPVFEQNMKLDVAVTSSQSLNLTSSKLTIGGNFNLTVAGTLAEPVILGRVSLAQGEIFFIGKRYELESGTIEFANAVRTEPVLNIYAKTTVDQYRITVNFVGPLDRLIARYTSDPPLSEGDIIHLIAFGNTAEAAASAPSTPSSLAAESILAQGVTSQISGKLENLTGISQISLDPLITDTVADPASQIAIQERVSGSLLLTFSSDVTNTQAQTVELQYKASKNVKVSVIRDYNGGYALDVRIHKAF
jgi:translocation and assembly module TamB